MGNTPTYVIGIDGSEHSDRAIDEAAKLAKATGASLHLVNIIDWSPYAPLSIQELAERPIIKAEEERYSKEEVLAPAIAKMKALGFEAMSFSTWGSPAKELHNQATELNADLIFMGRRGHSVIGELVLGSVANAVAHHSTLPVVLVP